MAGSASIDRRQRAETRPVTTRSRPADEKPTTVHERPRLITADVAAGTITSSDRPKPSGASSVASPGPNVRPKPLPSVLDRPSQRAVPPRRPDSRATTERRPDRFARGTSPPPDGATDPLARGLSPVLDQLSRELPLPDQLARGTTPNDAIDDSDDARATGVHDAQADDDDPLVEILNALAPPSESVDTDPFERAQAKAEPSVIIEPAAEQARQAERRDTPSVENHVVRTAWDPEHTSSTEQQLLQYQPIEQMWLGCVVAPPQVGAKLIIGRYMQSEFTVTSPVTKIITRQDGMLVQTTSKNRYFVDNIGATYLVRRYG